jgi:hypothetical protein
MKATLVLKDKGERMLYKRNPVDAGNKVRNTRKS